jgi:hypothetical protein
VKVRVFNKSNEELQGEWDSDQATAPGEQPRKPYPPPKIGSEAVIEPFGKVRVVDYTVVDGMVGALVKTLEPESPETDRLIAAIGGIRGNTYPYEKYSAEQLYRLRLSAVPKGSPFGPNQSPVPDKCVETLGGFGNYNFESELCVPLCPHAHACALRKHGIDPVLRIDAVKQLRKIKPKKAPPELKSPNRAADGTIEHAVLEEILEIAYDRDEEEIPVNGKVLDRLIRAVSDFKVKDPLTSLYDVFRLIRGGKGLNRREYEMRNEELKPMWGVVQLQPPADWVIHTKGIEKYIEALKKRRSK